MKQKIAEISFLHVFAILLVVIGHSFFRTESRVVDWIYQFHIPLFFFISGYLLHVSMQGKTISLCTFLLRKARRLLLPYFALSTLLFIPKVLLSRLMVRPIHAGWGEYAAMLIYPYRNVNGSYWFLPTLFLLFVFAAVLLSLSQRLKPRSPRISPCILLFLLALANTSLPFSQDTLFNAAGTLHYAFYFALGYFVSDFLLIRFLDKERTALLLFLLTLAASFISSNTRTAPLAGLLSALNGILMSVCLARLYTIHGLRFLGHLSPASYTIYLYHGIFQALSLQILTHLSHLEAACYQSLAILTGIYGPLIVYKVLYKFRNSLTGRILAIISGIHLPWQKPEPAGRKAKKEGAAASF